MPDATVRNEGSLFLVDPITDAAVQWIRRNVAEEAMFYGRSLVVEHRYIEDLVNGMISDGLVVQ